MVLMAYIKDEIKDSLMDQKYEVMITCMFLVHKIPEAKGYIITQKRSL